MDFIDTLLKFIGIGYLVIAVLFLAVMTGSMAAHRENIRSFLGLSWGKTIVSVLLVSLFWCLFLLPRKDSEER